MGTLIMTPNYTNLFIYSLEQHFIYISPTQRQEKVKQYFIDGCFIIET